MRITRYNTLAIATGVLLVSSLLFVEIKEHLPPSKAQPDLERMISIHPDGWTAISGELVDQKWSTSLQSSYDIVAARTYQNTQGKTVGIVITWSNDGFHRAGHLQQICYQANGFTVDTPKTITISTKTGKQEGVTFIAHYGNVIEEVVYWRITGGNSDNQNGNLLTLRWNNLVRLARNVFGNTPDNLMVRVSSRQSPPYQPDTAHLDYIRKYLEILPDGDRKVIMGQ